MNRLRWNLVVDVTALVSAVLMTSTGFILRYVLPPGSGRLESAGHGFGAMRRPIMVLWGLTRHEWGDIHYWLALVLMVVMSAHVLLHGRWIWAMLKGQKTEGSGFRLAVGACALMALLAFAAAPFFSSTVTMRRGELLDLRQN